MAPPSRATSPRRRPRGALGFSLIEILTAIVVMGILATIVGPKVASLSHRSTVEGAAQQLLGDLQRARMEAIKRNASVTLKRTGSSSYTITFVGTRKLSGATFQSGPDSVRFASFGPLQLGGGSTFVVVAGGYTRTVTLNAAGHASVQ